MTNRDFLDQLLRLSLPIAHSISIPGGNGIASQLGTLAMSITGTPDLDSALATLKADPAKLSALEGQVAARTAAIAAAPPAVSVGTAVPTAAAPVVLPPAPGVPNAVPAAGATPTAGTGKPSRGLMWVSPAVSGAVIVGFFAMLGILLYENYNLQVAVSAGTPSAVLATPTAATSASAPTSTSAPPTLPATGHTPAAPSAPAAKNPPALTNSPSTPSTSVTPASPTGGTTTPNSLQNVLFTLLGALGAAFTQVVNYWLGSSKGSSDKTDLLAATNPTIRGN
jgi:hypothetical protein